jgi:tungstate transport system ATP-binding protein
VSGALSLSGRNLTRTFKGNDFSLDVPFVEACAGCTLALLGPSGSGKTTLLHLLGLLDRPDTGEVFLGGKSVTPGDREAVLSMAAVFQRPYLFKGSISANVEYGLAVRGVPKARRGAMAESALARVGLEGYGTRSALQLSGGEAQRVSLARALVVEPKVLLVDEPLASLDPLLKRRLTHDFATILHEEQVTVVYVTHDQDEALVVADRVALMNEGRIVAHGFTEDVAGIAEDEWTASFLGIEPAFRGTVFGVSEGLAEVRCGEATITLVGEPEPRSEVLVAVRPEDVLLFEPGAKMPHTTARNRLKAHVTALEPRGATLRVALEANGVRLASSVSRAAVSELGLKPGSEVLAVFKATAVRWRAADP